MRVVRAGGQYLAGQEQRLWVALVVAATIAVGGLAVAAWTFLTRGTVAWVALVALLVNRLAALGAVSPGPDAGLRVGALVRQRTIERSKIA